MAENKKSFLLYCDLIHTVSKMPKEKAGELFIHILDYVNDKDPQTDDLIIQLTFEPIKQALKRDLQKYETIRQKNIENANKRWNKNNATASEPMQPNTKNAVIDNDSVIVNDRVIVKDINNKNILLSEIKISDLEYPISEYFEIAKAFQQLFIKNLKEKTAPFKNQENAKFKDYVDPIRLMIENDGVTKEQLQIVFKYLDSPDGEFWKSNILSIKKLREKLPQIIVKALQKPSQQSTQKMNAGELIKQRYGLS